jgi:hypothetical protein
MTSPADRLLESADALRDAVDGARSRVVEVHE